MWSQTLHFLALAKWRYLLRLQGGLTLARVAVIARRDQVSEISTGTARLNGLDVIHPKLLLWRTRATVPARELITVEDGEPHIARNGHALLVRQPVMVPALVRAVDSRLALWHELGTACLTLTLCVVGDDYVSSSD